ncbi:hypothetical protein I3842_16G013800 [Carya illinoinensis]|uniref:Uncharacterized protein n=1 Tax=Carya illinoinensis TaxID=32201 RepID=A0A921ZZH3_CARIL|nr:hypothetical protein I3842_16G013800 [Carya illinoinensis]
MQLHWSSWFLSLACDIYRQSPNEPSWLRRYLGRTTGKVVRPPFMSKLHINS